MTKSTLQKSLALALTSAAILMPLLALAAAFDQPTTILPTDTFKNLTGVIGQIRVVANWMLAFILVLAVIVLLVGAFQYLFSGGDAEKQTAARGRIVYGLIGVAIGVVALAIVNVVAQFVGGGTLGVPTGI